MKGIILVLVACTAALGQDASNRQISDAQKRSSTSYATSIIHSDEKHKDNQAQSSVHVDFHTGDTQQINYPQSSQQEQLAHQQIMQAYSQQDFTRDQIKQHPESQATQQSSELQYQGLKTDQDINSYIQAYHHQQQQQQHQPQYQPDQNEAHYKQVLSGNNQASYLGALATKQYLSINPLQHQTPHNQQHTQASNQKTIFVQKQPRTQQLYNVGYSINIDNNSGPKLSYRPPNPPRNAHSYRQQKLLNGDVITGTHKDKVEKPSGFSHQNYDQHLQSATNIHPSNYISIDHGKPSHFTPTNYGEKQQMTKVYSDVRNTHGYTWKNISPNVEISGYHSLEESKPSASHNFDHAAALGRTQSFDISNVVENGNKPYQNLGKPIETPPAFDVNKGLGDITPDIGDVPSDHSQSESVDIKFGSQNNFDFDDTKIPSFDFGTLKGSGLEFYNNPNGQYHHNLIQNGGNVEVDKSLLESFYKNYNPVFYQPEVTLPSPVIPKNINIKLHQSGSHPVPSYNLNYQQSRPVQFQPTSNQPDTQLMVNQHYAFVQAEGLKPQSQALSQSQSLSHSLNALSPLPSDTKPVQEQQEDNHAQQTHQQMAYYKPELQKELRGKYLTNEQKKYVPQSSGPRYTRPIIYGNEKNNFKLKSGMRPQNPMIIVRKNF